jgi:starch phosphorylase
MHKVRTFLVKPALPEPLKDLREIANNVFWAWDPEVVDLFRRIDPNLWSQCNHNPVRLLGTVSQGRLEDLSRNEGFLYQLSQMKEKLTELINRPTWYDRVYGRQKQTVIAYFSAEFGIHESIPIYSGGLGVLAGDHLKSASDLGVPLVGVGLMYQKGYFRQYLNSDGWQQEHLEENDFYEMPQELVRSQDNKPIIIDISFPNRTVKAQIWQIKVGRISLYLLDTNIDQNHKADRLITTQLYGGDRETRICQEIVLGIGGLRALVAMGMEPMVCHMNEGHAAFMALERICLMRERYSMTFEEAVEATKGSNVFTVHTPVAAGNDEFDIELMEKYFKDYLQRLGISKEAFLELGRVRPLEKQEKFKMPVLAIRMSSYRNGVSELHGKVSRQIWSGLWPQLPANEVPIHSVTNGIHMKSWISGDISSLFERYLGSNWAQEAIDKSLWQNIDQIPDEELWRAHQRCKERLVAFVRQRLRKQLIRRGAVHAELHKADEALDPEALTIGFARRFATYKRGNLILRDIERITKILNNPNKPLQLIFAGKAHPRDAGGKEIIKQIFHYASGENVRNRIVFLEDYDMDVARYLVQGVDIWLNNPRRPLEASGTSGMKAAVNGVLNLSTLDGWWCEGFTPDGGWVIGAGEEYADQGYQDMVESETLYNLLEDEIVGLYYANGTDRLPRRWLSRMKNTIKWCAPRFNTHRMVAEYTRRFYKPAKVRWEHMSADEMSAAKKFTSWKKQLVSSWQQVEIRDVDIKIADERGEQNLNLDEPQLEVGYQRMMLQLKFITARLIHREISKRAKLP